MKIILLLFIIISSANSLAQSTHNNQVNLFERVNGYYASGEEINYYPVADGDYWEYIEKDTVTIINQFYGGLNFSVTKEILNDTLLPNGITYKKIKWKNEANSVNYLPTYEYHRKDSSGNVYLYYEGDDYLLFNFTAGIGDTYPAHLPGYVWKVADKYNVIGFGDTLAAIDFNLFENGTTLKETYTLVENFGLIYYKKNINGYQLPEGQLWGAILNGVEFGTLIVNKQQVDWSEFYPLHIGDYWVYEGESGSIPFIETHRITGDTLMPDGIIYYIKDNSSFERLDSSGCLFVWSNENQSGILEYKFKDIVGDTAVYPDITGAFWRLNNKLYYNDRFRLYRFLYPDVIYYGQYFDQGLGLYEWSIEGGYGILRGAYINGVLYGDTTVVVIEDLPKPSDEFALDQNYPNPFNPVTTIKYSIPSVGTSPASLAGGFMKFVQLKVYDILGREVVTLVKEELPTGSYSIEFDGGNLPSGVYIYRLTAGNYSAAKKLILIK